MLPIRPTSTLRAAATVLAAAAAVPAIGAPNAHADKVTAGPPDLTRLYKGSDGSALYTRAVGTTVVGFGEHPSKKAAYVFRGTRSGSTITGSFWDVAKGSRTSVGSIELSVAGGGAKLERQGPRSVIPSTFTAVNASQFTSWPRRKEAGFQSTSQTDLDGAFSGGEDARVYARETSKEVVFVGEDWVSEAYARPKYATVFIGKRIGTLLKGEWFDVPKGTELRHGTFEGGAGPRPRRISVGQTDAATGQVTADRTGTFFADYAVDQTRFAKEIEDRLEPFVVGYGYAIADNGKIVKAGGGGARELPDDENELDAPRPFTADTENEIASTTKTLTAVAVVRELDEKGLTVDSPVAPWLPPGWAVAPSMQTVTFKQLLDHSAGLNHPGSICEDDPYACLQQSVANGLTAQPGYNNIHYTVMRFILPFLAEKDYMTQQWAAVTDPDERNELTSQAYEDTVKGMLMPYGIDIDTDYQGTNIAQRYSWSPPAAPKPVDLAQDGESLLGAGSGGFKVTPREYARFLSHLERGTFVKPALVERMKQDRLGFDDLNKGFRGTGGVGFLYTKNGGAGGTGTQSMMYPGDVQVFISRNSTGDTGLGRTSNLLRDAWQAALVD